MLYSLRVLVYGSTLLFSSGFDNQSGFTRHGSASDSQYCLESDSWPAQTEGPGNKRRLIKTHSR